MSTATRRRRRLSLDKAQPDPEQARRWFDEDELAELETSIEARGDLIHPICVMRSKKNAVHTIVMGERRWRCYVNLRKKHPKDRRWQTIPVMIVPAGTDAFLDGLVDNVQRASLNPIEEALGFQRLQKKYGLKQTEIARRVGKNQAHVSLRLSLLKLPRDIQRLVATKQLTAAHGTELVRHCRTAKEMREILRSLGKKRHGVSRIRLSTLRNALSERDRVARLLDAGVSTEVIVARELRSDLVPAGTRFLGLLEDLVGKEGEEPDVDAFAGVWARVPARDRTALLKLLFAITGRTKILTSRLQSGKKKSRRG